MKTINLFLFLCIAVISWGQIPAPPAPPPPPPPPPPPGLRTEAELEAYEKLQNETAYAFFTYINAVTAKDGGKAGWSLSKQSWKYYKDLQNHVLYSSAKELEKVNLFTQKAILKARLCLDEDSIQAWDSLTFFKRMTEYGYLADNWEFLEGVVPSRVRQVGDSAQTRIFYTKRKPMQKNFSPKYINYYKEFGAWRVDISPIIIIGAEDFRRKYEVTWGHSPQKYIIHLLEKETDGKISESIWKPLFKRRK